MVLYLEMSAANVKRNCKSRQSTFLFFKLLLPDQHLTMAKHTCMQVGEEVYNQKFARVNTLSQGRKIGLGLKRQEVKVMMLVVGKDSKHCKRYEY